MALKWQNKAWPEICQRFGLSAGGSASAGDKAFDGFGMRDMRGGLAVHGGSKKNMCPLCLRRNGSGRQSPFVTPLHHPFGQSLGACLGMASL
jgi:hypothetical protein